MRREKAEKTRKRGITEMERGPPRGPLHGSVSSGPRKSLYLPTEQVKCRLGFALASFSVLFPSGVSPKVDSPRVWDETNAKIL